MPCSVHKANLYMYMHSCCHSVKIYSVKLAVLLCVLRSVYLTIERISLNNQESILHYEASYREVLLASSLQSVQILCDWQQLQMSVK